MQMEQLRMIIDLIGGLGDEGANAFVWWIGFKYITSLLCHFVWAFVVYRMLMTLGRAIEEMGA